MMSAWLAKIGACDRVRAQRSESPLPSPGQSRVLFAGQFQNGKSTLLNCLLGGNYAIEGNGLHTTAYRTVYSYTEGGPQLFCVDAAGRRIKTNLSKGETTIRKAEDVHFEMEVLSSVLKRMTLIDAPGWGAEDFDDRQAEQALDEADFVVYLAQPKQFSDSDKEFLRLLKNRDLYFCIVLNVLNEADPQMESLANVANAIAGAVKQQGLAHRFIRFPSPSGICPINLLWAKYGSHLLDHPTNSREETQRRVVLQTFGLTASDSQDEILTESGLVHWLVFLSSSVALARQFQSSVSTTTPRAMVDAIRSSLVRILTKDN